MGGRGRHDPGGGGDAGGTDTGSTDTDGTDTGSTDTGGTDARVTDARVTDARGGATGRRHRTSGAGRHLDRHAQALGQRGSEVVDGVRR
ncbi:hypothetical protein E3T47_10420 [Cryobacterium ruanii]|uniref:Uncharacterized protein n=1 Tax=Cryobacterium ruanii TaxID=1259197 RepID=A0A4R9AMC9_9MICO|nr:hypothetical protein E3T47_10420 [Cryobacterium ruanii]